MKVVEINPLKKMTFNTDKFFSVSTTINFTILSFIEKESCPNIMNMTPIALVVKIYLRFMLKIIFN